jgi:hypothetical protein
VDLVERAVPVWAVRIGDRLAQSQQLVLQVERGDGTNVVFHHARGWTALPGVASVRIQRWVRSVEADRLGQTAWSSGKVG